MEDPIAAFTDTSLNLSEGTGVFDITLEIPAGKIMVLIGPSGSGKSTLLRLLLGLLTPDDGRVQVFGENPVDLSSGQRARIAYVPQKFVLYPDLSVIENIRFASSMYGASLKERSSRIDDALEVVQLSEVRKRLARDLSGGMRRRLQFAAALISDFDILIADEATAGVDPILREEMWTYLKGLREAGRTVILTTQYIAEAENGDLIAVIDEGRLVISGTAEHIRSSVMPHAVIEIEVDPDQTLDVLALLEEQPFTERAYRLPEQPGVIHVQVVDVDKPDPHLTHLLNENGFQPDRVEVHHIPFNDIFRNVLEGQTA